MSVIEFFGMPRAGKTTQSNRLKTAFDAADISYLVCGRPNISFRDAGSLEKFHELMYENLLRHHDLYQSAKYDYLMLDRGFYDRSVLLELDYHDSKLSEEFAEDFQEKLRKGSLLVDVPLLMLVDPQISLDRWVDQKREGLDYSELSKGLDTKEALIVLEEQHKIYKTVAANNSRINVIDCNKSKAEVTKSIFKYIF